jgi:hypothetical protein
MFSSARARLTTGGMFFTAAAAGVLAISAQPATLEASACGEFDGNLCQESTTCRTNPDGSTTCDTYYYYYSSSTE